MVAGYSHVKYVSLCIVLYFLWTCAHFVLLACMLSFAITEGLNLAFLIPEMGHKLVIYL